VLEELGAEKEALEAYKEALKVHPTLGPAKSAVARLEKAQTGQGL
jgi:hypothetical protein